MRRCREQQIGDLIRQFMRSEGIEDPYNQYRVVASLGEVLGAGIMRHVKNSYIRNQTLVVELSSPILRQELNMGRTQLVRRINEQVGAQVISDIRFC